VVGSEQLPILIIGFPLHSVIIDTLKKWKEIKCEGIESDYVGQVNIIEGCLQKLRILGLMVVIVGYAVKVEDTQPDEGGCDSARGQGKC
jgi:deoxyhypusine synthase